MITVDTVDVDNMKIWHPVPLKILQVCEIPDSDNPFVNRKLRSHSPPTPPPPPATTLAAVLFKKQLLSLLVLLCLFYPFLLRVVDLSERESAEEKAGKMISDNP